MSTLKERLVKLRNEKNLLQKDVAKGIDMSLVGYQRYEYGTRSPTAEVIIALAHFYEVSTDYLLGLSDDPSRH